MPAKKRLWIHVRTASSRRFLRVLTIYVLSSNVKNISFFFENFHFVVIKFSVYLNRHVFVMGDFTEPALPRNHASLRCSRPGFD